MGIYWTCNGCQALTSVCFCHVHPCPVCNKHVDCGEGCDVLLPEQTNRNGQRLAAHVVCDNCESEVTP